MLGRLRGMLFTMRLLSRRGPFVSVRQTSFMMTTSADLGVSRCATGRAVFVSDARLSLVYPASQFPRVNGLTTTKVDNIVANCKHERAKGKDVLKSPSCFRSRSLRIDERVGGRSCALICRLCVELRKTRGGDKSSVNRKHTCYRF